MGSAQLDGHCVGTTGDSREETTKGMSREAFSKNKSVVAPT